MNYSNVFISFYIEKSDFRFPGFFHASQEALKNPEENVDGRKNHTK